MVKSKLNLSSHNFFFKKGYFPKKIKKISFSFECKDITMKDILLNSLFLESLVGFFPKSVLKRTSSNKMRENELEGKILMSLENTKEIESFIKNLYFLLSPKEKSLFFKAWKNKDLCHLTLTNFDTLMEITTKYKLSYSYTSKLKANLYIWF
jgi:hypothetical protein